MLLEQFKGFCATPSIILPNSFPYVSFEFPEIEINRAIEENLKQLDHPRNSVLGKRMESFFQIAINNSARYELIGSNIQVIFNKQTLGEIDFLLYDTFKNKPLHIELVYKLYIYNPDIIEENARWIGPNLKDSFPEKLKKLQQRQFPLLKRPETQPYLKNFSFKNETIEQQICFKAKLYQPAQFKKSVNTVNEYFIEGKWYRFSEFVEQPWKDNLFCSPKKSDWSIPPKDNKNWVSFSEILIIIQELFQRKKSPLIWMKSLNSYSSFFIVWW